MNATRVSINAWRKPGLAITLFALVLILRPVKGSEVVITVTGTLIGGSDTFPIFDVGRDLDGKPFTLVYTFDDTKGIAAPLGGCKGAASGRDGDGKTTLGTAVLTVGTKSYTFGTRKDAHASVWREINSACSNSQIDVEVHESFDPFVSGANVRIHPEAGKPSLTQNPDWTAPLSTTGMEGWSALSGFAIARPHDFYHFTRAAFFIKTLTVARKR